MKAVILAGGYGTRISEETWAKPKPLIEIGGKPILWHVMKIYAAHGINDFIICLGYKGYLIKEFFANYYLHTSDVTFDLCSNSMAVLRSTTDPWRVTLIDTGENTMTGGRLKRIGHMLDDEAFCATYGDGVADVDVTALIATHEKQKTLVTLTAVQPPGRFGALDLIGDRVASFREKPQGDGAWVNGGFFVINPKALTAIDDDATPWEREPLERLAADSEVHVYRHHGFFQPLDTVRDKQTLESLWTAGRAPWKLWL